MGQASIAPMIMLSTLGNFGAAAMSSIGQANANAMATRFNAQQAKLNRDFQERMYNQQHNDMLSFYNENQSPQAIAKALQQLGINPSVAMANGSGLGSSSASMPSGLSGSQASVGSLGNGMASFQNVASDTAKIIDSLSSKSLRDTQALKLLAETKGQEFANRMLEFDSYLQQTYGENEKILTLRNLILDAALKDANKEYILADTKLKQALKLIADRDLNIKDEEYGQLVIRGMYLAQSFEDAHSLNEELLATEKSKQSSNYASAKASNASAALSLAQKAGQELTNVMLRLDSESAQKTALSKLDALEASLRKSTWEDNRDRAKAEVELRKLRERIIHYEKYPNAASFDDFWDNFPIIGGIVRGLAK